jgi:thiamine-phosphate diphosphorylase
VVITGDADEALRTEDYVSAPHAQGWLTLPSPSKYHPGTGCMFAASTAVAMSLGFVPVEAVVLAKMVSTEVLPGMSIGVPGPVAPFAALSDKHLGLYAIVDSAAWVQRVLAAGVRTVQLRIKDPQHPGLREEVRSAVAAARACKAQLFINDHWRLALEEGAYGVHLGQEDLALADLDAIARAGLRLGVSTHALWEVSRAWQLKPSYIACGPIHPTAAKAMPWIPQGNENLAYWCKLLPLPVVAIAGMDRKRAAQAMQCGAAGVAVISAITTAASPEAEMVELQRAIATAPGARVAPPLLPRPTLRAQ